MAEWRRTTLELIVEELQRPVPLDESFERRVMVRVRRAHAQLRPRGVAGYIGRAIRTPPKSNPVLVVDADTPLAFSISAQSLEPVSRWNAHVGKALGQIKLHEFAQSLTLNACPFAHMLQLKELPRVGVSKGHDHTD